MVLANSGILMYVTKRDLAKGKLNKYPQSFLCHVTISSQNILLVAYILCLMHFIFENVFIFLMESLVKHQIDQRLI